MTKPPPSDDIVFEMSSAIKSWLHKANTAITATAMSFLENLL